MTTDSYFRITFQTLVFSAAVTWLHLTNVFETTNDFIQYWSAFRLFMNNQNPYDSLLLLEHELLLRPSITQTIMMWNPPILLVILSPILILQYPFSLFFYLSFCFFMLFLFIETLSGWNKEKNTNHFIITLALLSVTFAPSVALLESAQSSGMPLVGLILFCITLHSEKRWLWWTVGITLCLTKPNAAWLALPFVYYWALRNFIKKESRKFLIFNAVLLLFYLILFHETTMQWLSAILNKPQFATALFSWQPYSLNQFIIEFLNEALGHELKRVHIALVFLSCMIFGMLVAIYYFLRWNPRFIPGLGISVGASHLFAPHLFAWDFVTLLPFFLILYSYYHCCEEYKKLSLLILLSLTLFILENIYEAAPVTFWLVSLLLIVILHIERDNPLPFSKGAQQAI